MYVYIYIYISISISIYIYIYRYLYLYKKQFEQIVYLICGVKCVRAWNIVYSKINQ